jgi:hypothetical protein
MFLEINLLDTMYKTKGSWIIAIVDEHPNGSGFEQRTQNCVFMGGPSGYSRSLVTDVLEGEVALARSVVPKLQDRQA